MSLMHFNKAVIFSYKPALKKLKRMENSAKEDAGESSLCLVPRGISNSESLVWANINQYQSILLSNYISNKVLKSNRICS